jgi:hypothetical protein
VLHKRFVAARAALLCIGFGAPPAFRKKPPRASLPASPSVDFLRRFGLKQFWYFMSYMRRLNIAGSPFKASEHAVMTLPDVRHMKANRGPTNRGVDSRS